MSYWARLWRIEMCAIAALIASATMMVIYALGSVSPEENSLLSPTQSAYVIFAYSLYFGFAPLTLFGAPVYAALGHANKATWWGAAIIGVLPGIVVLIAEGRYPRLGWFFLFWGPIVALGTHWLAKLTVERSVSSRGDR